MSLDISLMEVRKTEVFETNITHNCAAMAKEAGIYGDLWHPQKNMAKYARDIVDNIKRGYNVMRANPDHYRSFEPENGWGLYDQFLAWLEYYIYALEQHPDAEIEVSR